MQPLPEGQGLVELALQRADGPVLLGEDPRRGALEEVELLHARGDLGDDLDGRRARADDGHGLPREVIAMVPTRRVEDLALEVGQSR
jgi:hypothetical protein